MLAEIVTRLKDTADCPFVDAGGALAPAAVKTAPGRSPVAFVLPIADRGRPAAVTAVRRRISSRLGVMPFVRRYGDTHGADKAASLEAPTAWTRAGLAGRQAAADHAPMEFACGALDEVNGNIAVGMGKSLDRFIEAVGDAATGEMERPRDFGIVASRQGDKVAFTFRGIATVVERDAARIRDYLKRIGTTHTRAKKS